MNDHIYLVTGCSVSVNEGDCSADALLAFKSRENAGNYLNDVRKEHHEDEEITILEEHWVKDVSYSVKYLDKYKCRQYVKWYVKKIDLED